jgi:membrane protein
LVPVHRITPFFSAGREASKQGAFFCCEEEQGAFLNGGKFATEAIVLSYFQVPLTWTELLKRTARETQNDNGFGLAAELAYYFFLALFPALLFMLALVSFFPVSDLPGRLAEQLASVAPPEVTAIIRDQLAELWQGRHGGLLTFGFIAALWSSSAALVALIDALDRVYDIEDSRPWWRRRLMAILLTLGLAAFIIASSALILAGPELARLVADRVGLGTAFEWTWRILQWPLVFGLVASGIGLVYYFAPDVEQDFVWLTPGSVTATLLWLAASLGFRLYVVNFGAYNQTYGAIGAVMVLLVWLYLSALAVIVGGELNAEIEHASTHSLAGPILSGRRRIIGGRAAREFQQRQQREPEAVPSAAAHVPGQRTPGAARAMGRVGALIGGLMAALSGRRVRH